MMRATAFTMGLAAAASMESQVVRIAVDAGALGATGGEMTCWIQDGMKLDAITSDEGVTLREERKGGVFVRTVYNAENCRMCQVDNIADHPVENIADRVPLTKKPKHAANAFTATQMTKSAVGSLTTQAQYEADASGKLCFCSVGQTPIMFFLGVTARKPCSQEDCYEQYIYAAEKSVLPTSMKGPGKTPLFLIPTALARVDAVEGAWTKTCCDASLDDCPISESNGIYQLNEQTSELGTFITPFGTLMGEGTGEETDIGFYTWECPDTGYCRVGPVAVPSQPAVCYETLKGKKTLASPENCPPEGKECPALSLPECRLQVCRGDGDCSDNQQHAYEAATALFQKI